jgi:hypothetical protein
MQFTRQVHFDLAVSCIFFLPAFCMSYVKDCVWERLAKCFVRRQKIQDGAFIAAFLDGESGVDGKGTSEAALLSLSRRKLRLIRWSKFKGRHAHPLCLELKPCD